MRRRSHNPASDKPPVSTRAENTQKTLDSLKRKLLSCGFKEEHLTDYLTQEMSSTVCKLTGWAESTYKTFLDYMGKDTSKLSQGFRDYIPTERETHTIQTEMPHGFGVVLHYLGCRFSEMWELSYDCTALYEAFDNNDYLIIPGKKGSNRVRLATKDLPGSVAYALRQWILHKGETSQHKIRRKWAELRRNGEISEKLIPHSFRHSLISELILDGVPIAEVASTVGHRSVNTTYRYLHQSPTRQTQIRNSRKSILEEIVGDG